MTWSLATATWVAPSCSSCKVELSTPTVASYGVGRFCRLAYPKCCRNSSYVPSIRCTRIGPSLPSGVVYGELHWYSAQVRRIHLDPQRTFALPCGPDRCSLFGRAYQLSAFSERRAYGQALDDGR